MYFLSGNNTITETKEIYNPLLSFAPIAFWIILIAIITALGLLFKRRIGKQAKDRQLLQNIEMKLDKLMKVLENKST